MATQEEKKIPSYRSTGFDFTINKPLKYPLANRSDHFVRFSINLDEESRLIREGKVTVLGNVDQTDQNRLRQRPINQDVFNVAVGGLGATKGAVAGAALAIRKLKGFPGNKFRAAGNVVGGTVLGGAAGGAIGATIASQINIDKKLKRLSTEITLYTPQTVMMNQRTDWENYNDVIFDLLNSGFAEEVVNSVKTGNISNAANRVSDEASGIASAAGRIVATAASDLVQSATRTAVNPKKDLLFRGIDRREFTFEYQFAPRSAEEAKEVANIIHAFRLFSAPEVIENTMDYLYVYPAEFDIEYGFIKNNIEEQNKYLNKISSCVLRSVFVNYAPNGSFQSLENGEPVQVNMTLHFQEIETLHRDRIAKGY